MDRRSVADVAMVEVRSESVRADPPLGRVANRPPYPVHFVAPRPIDGGRRMFHAWLVKLFSQSEI
jgi:hypothetical protein